MTPAERLAARIAKNREIDQRVQDNRQEKKPAESATPSGRKRASVGIHAKPASNTLDKFQEIKRTQGIDAASDFVQSRIKSVGE